MRNLALIGIVFVGLFAFGFVYNNNLSGVTVHESVDFDTTTSKPELTPGKTIQFKMKDSYNNRTSVCELRVPEHYIPNKAMPILVWFSPGKGSHSIKSVPSFVDFKEYFILALPYLDNQLPRIAIRDGYIDDLWEYDRQMLEYVANIIPNLSLEHRIAAGFSSGAHFIASGLDRDWSGFTDFFTGYVLHEGGYAPDMTYKGIDSSHKVLVTYGESIDSYGKVVAQMMTQEHDNITVYGIENTGHEVNGQTIHFVKEWIKNSFI